ncbi:hypothetical protein G5C60_46975 [Streptomyces sp. HC44]|uniref:Uncharacterized protein n=1 Tax=Streptomyces scabichelini TaxID=2711217 RepID=A0A6G4VME5_9ACTN|nr:hypothetical protein [Streptomyces scabichelini]NGO14943.1 hypothetical protein [Streptomyces scabichelini]
MNSLLTTKSGTAQDDLITTPRESDLGPLLAAWELAHPAAADPEWRHLLDEMAHPHTTQAFHRLARTAA